MPQVLEQSLFFLLCKVLSPVAVALMQLALAKKKFPYVRICAEHPTCGRAIAGRSVSIDGESGLGISFFAHIGRVHGNELPPLFFFAHKKYSSLEDIFEDAFGSCFLPKLWVLQSTGGSYCVKKSILFLKKSFVVPARQ